MSAVLISIVMMTGVLDRAPGRDEAPGPTIRARTPGPVEVKSNVVVEPKADAERIEIVLSEDLLKALMKESDEHSFVPRARTMTAGVALAASMIFLGLWASGASLRNGVRRLMKWGAPVAGLAFAFVVLSGFTPDVAPGPGPGPKPRPRPQVAETRIVDGRIQGPVLIRIVKDAKEARVIVPHKALKDLVGGK